MHTGDGPTNATVKYAEERLGLDSGTLATPASLGEAQAIKSEYS